MTGALLPTTELGGVPSGSSSTNGGRIVLVHGFTQTATSWRIAADRLSAATATDDVDAHLLGVDLPGHGATDPAHDTADLAAAARLLGATGGRATYVGYSMGGRVALRLALDRPDLVERLVLIGATAGIDDPADRTARRAADDALADHVLEVGTEAFIGEWLRGPLFAGLEPVPEDLVARRANRAEGLAASLRHAGTGTMDPPWWDDLVRVAAPTLVLAGEHDPKFRALAARLTAAIGPTATDATVAGTGHAVHLEQPEATAATIAGWLRRHPGDEGATG